MEKAVPRVSVCNCPISEELQGGIRACPMAFMMP